MYGTVLEAEQTESEMYEEGTKINMCLFKKRLLLAAGERIVNIKLDKYLEKLNAAKDQKPIVDNVDSEHLSFLEIDVGEH